MRTYYACMPSKHIHLTQHSFDSSESPRRLSSPRITHALSFEDARPRAAASGQHRRISLSPPLPLASPPLSASPEKHTTLHHSSVPSHHSSSSLTHSVSACVCVCVCLRGVFVYLCVCAHVCVLVIGTLCTTPHHTSPHEQSHSSHAHHTHTHSHSSSALSPSSASSVSSPFMGNARSRFGGSADVRLKAKQEIEQGDMSALPRFVCVCEVVWCSL